MRYLFLFLSALSCTEPDIIPICPNVTYTVTDLGEEYKVRFVIDSTEPYIIMTRESGRVDTIQPHYFGCVIIRAVEGETVRFGSCQVEINKN